MINFTVGPVQSPDEVREIASQHVPYFRTSEFSKIMLENEEMILSFIHAKEGSRVAFMTCSGTGSMEASVINLLTDKDKALVINGGSFGQRFADLLSLHEIPHSEIKLEKGKNIHKEDLIPFEEKGYTAFLVNIHETSTGVLYDIDLIADFCKRNHMLFIVDAISSFLADPFDMSKYDIDVMITGSQKALACHPGISLIALSPKALKRVEETNPKCMYLDLKSALKNGERGQTPFTPAVGILLQIHARLTQIKNNGGVEEENRKTHELATYFRDQIKDLPLEIVSESLSNAVTPLHPLHANAYEIFTILKDEYSIWVCPNGGDMKETIFRVGHIGYLTKEDYDKLILALHDLYKRGILW